MSGWYTNGVLNLELKKYENKTYRLTIINIIGRTVYQGTISSHERKQIHLDQPEGIYIVRVNDEKESFTKKVFIR